MSPSSDVCFFGLSPGAAAPPVASRSVLRYSAAMRAASLTRWLGAKSAASACGGSHENIS